MKLLLAINTSAGTGHNPVLGQEMATSLRKRLGPDHSVQMNWGHGHGEIRRHAGEFARQNKHDSVIIAGGGGGTLRAVIEGCLLYTSPSPRDATLSRMPSSA